MKPVTTRAASRTSRRERADVRAPGLVPELRFRAMPPSEPLLLLAREQAALCGAMLGFDRAPMSVEIERRADELGGGHEVVVRGTRAGVLHCGRARHTVAELALREAFSELLRNTARATPCPCAAA